MPIYEYACISCGNEFETLVRVSAPTPECPNCHGTQLNKKLSTFAAIGGGADAFASDAAACGTCGNPGGPGACRFN
jgi:putative FmdB family regulatory protein